MKIIAPDDERKSNFCLRQQNRIIFPTESKYRDRQTVIIIPMVVICRLRPDNPPLAEKRWQPIFSRFSPGIIGV